ncbi:histidine triad nucleotide-binding protein [Streptomyces millisiae]|uniref:Histidine triad nucleotide-binding protein n=1 Tax=Streptomyces millisiae TaxID=3075542 RepID=A0ABU2M0Z2_9ACTN|nr:histidine triad nucleotide-binding protein [Streptomyces sp. DSM 44918]MDT0323465.1 histidine triad nucleotide-binding protein [Streptomyces sp. DSM 44918]
MAGEPRADCLFCKIVAGEVPATIVKESEAALAFRDINPQAPTHVLVIPRAHYPDAASLATAAPELAAEVLRLAGDIAADEKIVDPGYRVVFNTGPGAGQTVFHAHAHVLGGRGLEWPPG